MAPTWRSVLFAEPTRLCQGRQTTKYANARAPIMADRQQQQFQFGFRTLFGPSSHPSDGTNSLIDGCIANIRNPRAACFAPKRVKALSFDFAGKQGTHPGAGKTEPNPIDEISREHKGVAEYMTDSGRFDFGTRWRGTFAPLTVPIVENEARRCMLHETSCAAAKR